MTALFVSRARHLRRAASVFTLSFVSAVSAQTEIPLWAEGPPPEPLLTHAHPESVEDKRETGRLDRWIGYVSRPTLTVFPADPAKATGAAVLVIPGGGFRYVCIDKEGFEAVPWLNSLGVTVAVLKYRTLDPEMERSAKTVVAAFPETERALRVLRHRAAEWKLDPRKIGTLGFSAGAVMAVRLAIDADEGDPAAADPIERMGSRSDFIALVYTGLPPGKFPKSIENPPPVFLVHASDDPKAPVAAAVAVHKFFLEAKGSCELHVFHRGDHGFGMQPKAGTVRAWPTLCADWLRDLGMVAP